MIKPELMTLAEQTAQLVRPYASFNIKPEIVSSASAVRRYALLLQVEDTYTFSVMSMEQRLAREMLESIKAFFSVASEASDDSLALMLHKLSDHLADICASYPEQDNKEPF